MFCGGGVAGCGGGGGGFGGGGALKAPANACAPAGTCCCGSAMAATAGGVAAGMGCGIGCCIGGAGGGGALVEATVAGAADVADLLLSACPFGGGPTVAEDLTAVAFATSAGGAGAESLAFGSSVESTSVCNRFLAAIDANLVALRFPKF